MLVRRRERAGLAGPRSNQGTIHGALKARLLSHQHCATVYVEDFSSDKSGMWSA
jgi:hypothetical protein